MHPTDSRAMTSRTLGIIGCPMLEDNLVYCLERDPDEKDIAIIRNDNIGSLCRKLEAHSVGYRTVEEEDVLAGRYEPSPGRFNLLIYMLNLGLHSVPEELKARVEGLAERMQPYVDAIGFYLGTCGSYNWNIPEWCRSKGFKPSAMFCDKDGNLCHDCVGVNIAGGPRYLDLERKYTGYLYVFPAMAANYDDFMMANNKDTVEATRRLTPDMMEALGIEPGPDGYMRWLLSLGNYKHMLKLDNGIGDEDFDANIEKLKERTHLDVVVAEPGWASTQPTVDLYAKCKSFLDERNGARPPGPEGPSGRPPPSRPGPTGAGPPRIKSL